MTLSPDAKHFYFRLRIRKIHVSETMTLLRNTFEKVVDFGLGTEDGPKDWWAEIRHPGEHSGTIRKMLLDAGLKDEEIKQCLEISPFYGQVMANKKQLYLVAEGG